MAAGCYGGFIWFSRQTTKEAREREYSVQHGRRKRRSGRQKPSYGLIPSLSVGMRFCVASILLATACLVGCGHRPAGVVGTWKRVSGWGNFEETWDLRADGSYLIKTGSAERSQAKKHGTYAFEDGILSFFWIRDNTRSFGSDRPDQ